MLAWHSPGMRHYGSMRRLLHLLLPLCCLAPAQAEEIGECRFDRASLSFAGPPVEQAHCLLRKVKLLGEKRPQHLPHVLRDILSGPAAPTQAQKSAAMAALPEPYRTYAAEHQNDPVSKTTDGLPAAYFVIHDTNEPFYGNAPFPKDLDNDWKLNSFTAYMDKTYGPAPVAHIFLTRYGQIWAGHDFSEPWRATKLESSRVIGKASRGRFVHIETVQPRRYLPGYSDRQHTYGPKPAFSRAQYRMLAALYVYASARAGRWLIPAFHATMDAGIPDAHDAPQNFNLRRFGKDLKILLKSNSETTAGS